MDVVIKPMGYTWHLRDIMSARGMYQTSDLVGPLTERGIVLSREQVYRLVTNIPQRLNLDVLAALCDILDCGPQDLIEVQAAPSQVAKTGNDRRRTKPVDLPGRTVVRRPGSTA